MRSCPGNDTGLPGDKKVRQRRKKVSRGGTEESSDGRVLWANPHLLFWLSLFPFVTGWVGENEFAPGPVAFYGVIMLGAAFAYFILTRVLIALHGRDSVLAAALGRDFKGRVSVVIYGAAIPLSFVNSWFACGLYVLVAILWLIPDRRIEKTISNEPTSNK